MSLHSAVLVLEDDTDLALQWQRALEASGYAVTLVENADVAIEALHETEFAAVVLDMFVVDEEGRFLPRGGLTVMSEIRLRIEPKPPIVVVSGALFDMPARREGVLTDVTVVLRKPVRDAQLVAAVGGAIDARRATTDGH